MSNDILKAAMDGLTDVLVNAVGVYKKHESTAQTIVDVLEVEIADQKLKAELGTLMAAGFSGVLAALKQAGTDLEGDIELLPALVLDTQKIIAAFKA